MIAYLDEFLIIALVHLLAVASPGPDFAIVLKQSIRYGLSTALATSLGIGVGILVHVAYSLVGIGVIIASNDMLFTLLKFIAAAYFCYIAWHSIGAKKPEQVSDIAIDSMKELPSTKKAFLTGFLVNGLNVKATLFFVSLFSMVISPTTPIGIQLGYGIYMAIATAIWFSFLSYLLSHDKMNNIIQTKGYLIERAMGVVLIVLAGQLLMTELTPAV